MMAVMKIFFLSLFALLAAAPSALLSGEKADSEASKPDQVIVAKVDGMVCGACVNHVTQALLTRAEVEDVFIHLATGSVLAVEKTGKPVEDARVRDLINALGFEVLAVEHTEGSFTAMKAALEEDAEDEDA